MVKSKKKITSIGENFIYNTRTKAIGTEYINSEGFVTVKVAPGIWKHKQILVWEQEKGKRPKGCNIIHIDGNKQNNDIENLYCLTPSELGSLYKTGGIRGCNADLRKLKLTIAKLNSAIKKRNNKSTVN